MYTDFAYAYDRLMVDVPYTEWARYYAELLQLYGVRPGARCVECACGTGNLTIPLARLGYSMVGMDLSAEMLNRAQQKAREQGMTLPFVRMDMRHLSVQRPVDAVLATCDGPNYLLTEHDLSTFFDRAMAALRPGGVLAFDVSTPFKIAQALGDQSFTTSEEDLVYIWQGQYHEHKHTLEIHLDAFIQESSGLYKRIQEDQCQRAYTREELSNLLQISGFRDIRFFGDRTMEVPETEAIRWHVTAQKGV